VRPRDEPRSSDGFLPGGAASTDASQEGFLQHGRRNGRAKDSEHVSARRALRRYMVEEELMDRRDGIYWRAGGTFELD
jgi:hypothetical protein